MWNYTNKVMDHFRDPRNVGYIKDPDGEGEVGSMACGDALRLMFKLDSQGRIADVKFQTFGCGSAIASSSALTEMIKGKTVEEAEKVTNKDIADYLGGLPEQKMHCSVLGREALEAAIENYRTGKVARVDLEGRVICICMGVTEERIEKAIVENDLFTVEQVTNYTKAGGGCGGCIGEIEEILARHRWEKRKTCPAVPEKPKEPLKGEALKKKLTNVQKIRLVQETIDREIRPEMQKDGGDLELVDVEGDKVILSLRGNCVECKVASFTLKTLVEPKLHEFVSEDLVVELEQN
ncbi:MAG: Fe-S cluster assembly protein NifU [Gemmatimonadota bacterium]|nr:Fe-S cluster assembly protein NifU [Gemmatimonadota bacterium]